jgi:Flp pilus assembly protein TadG
MLIASFLRDVRANFAPMFALTLVPIVGFIGTAVDYSRGNSVKAAMQMALDSTGLMLSKDAATLTAEQMSQKATTYFNAMFNQPEAQNVQLTAALSTPQAGSYKLNIAAKASIDARFLRVFGQNHFEVGSTTEVVWGIKKLELALALDNTGSMSSNSKMTELKKAAKALLDTLKLAAQKADDVKVAIVPFDTTVRIGKAYKNESWLDLSVKNINKDDWEGCVIDRDWPNDGNDATPDGSSARKFPASQCGPDIVRMLPLTDITTGIDTLKNKIDAMQPDGNTNVTIGLAWGWHALTNSLPLEQASVPKPDLDKVIILLTDGNNTQAWDNINKKNISTESSINARTEAACANVKAANIRIYTIRVINGNGTLLKNCASNPSMYFDVQQASQLNGVFTSIAQNLANLRIAK